MGLSLSALLAPVTAEQAETDILAALDDYGFPATSWHVKSVPRTLVKWFATKWSEATKTVAAIAGGGYLATAAEMTNSDGTEQRDWLDLYAESQYDEVRTAATSTVGKFLLTNTSGSPHTIVAGQLWIRDVATQKLLYQNTTGGALGAAVGATLEVSVLSEGPGAAYNLPNGVALELATPLPGVAATNPAVGSTGTWITSAGGDIEGNRSYADRSRAKWATLGTGGGAPAYAAWAIKGAPTITRTLVDDANPRGPGTVDIYLANATGPATPAEIAAAKAYSLPKKNVTAGAEWLAAVAKPVTITATVEVLSAYEQTAVAAAIANISAMATDLDIGEDVYLSEIITALSSPTGIRRVTVSAPTSDQVVAQNEIVTFTLNLTTVVV